MVAFACTPGSAAIGKIRAYKLERLSNLPTRNRHAAMGPVDALDLLPPATQVEVSQ